MAEPVFRSNVDCTNCGCGLPGDVASMAVTAAPRKKVVPPRLAVGVAFKSSAMALVAACGPAPTPTAAPTAASRPTVAA